MNILVLKGYNNYFNRIIKMQDSIQSYKNNSSSYLNLTNINFNPNDGVATELVLGTGELGSFLDFEKTKAADYLVCYTSTTVEEVTTDTIESRWFILEINRTRGGQYKLALRRDVIADNYNETITAPIYLEKGYIKNTTNPLLYNSEGLKLNQIKQYEVSLQDETKTGWIVGYIPNNWSGATVKPKVIVPANADFTCAGLSNWEYYPYCEQNPDYKPCWGDNWHRDLMIKFKGHYTSNSKQYWGKNWIRWTEYNTGWNGEASPWVQATTTQQNTAPDWWNTWSNFIIYGNGDTYISTADQKRLISNLPGNATFENLVNAAVCEMFNVNRGDKDYIMSMNGKTLYDSVSGLFYRIRTVFPTPYNWAGTISKFCSTSGTYQSQLITYVNNNIVRTGFGSCNVLGNIGDGDVGVVATQNFVGIVLEQNAIDTQCTIDTQRAHLQDAPYDMFCIPYSDTLKLYDGTDTFTCNKAVALSMATAIGEEGGSGSVYDVQLLPYCPVRELINRSSNPADTIDITTVSYDLITQETTGTKLSAVIWSPRSTFSFDINELHDINYCKFRAPYTSLGSTTIPTKKYLVLKDLPTTITERRAVNTPSAANNIVCYKVDKTTGSIIEDLGRFNCIQMEPSINVLQVYTYGHYMSPEIDMGLAAYNNSNWYLMFYIDGPSYGSQNMALLCESVKYPSQYYYEVDLSTPMEAKLTNECNLYRLSAGNQSSLFEFSPAKSFGFNGYKVDCTYKPFQPWIHIIPNLGGLYGDQFVSIDDSRGLICGGDYSVTQLTNTWATYKLQNSTYQEMFDREIKHMDVENSIQEQQGWFQAVTGVIGGGVAGGVAGAKGGVAGAIAGAVIGTGASYTGAVMDIQNMYKMQYENKDYKTDMYNYSLRNMQAIPSGLSKTSAFVYNTRIWPFLEVFTCTETEREAMKDKLTYDGMTIMAIGKLMDYLDPEEKHFWRGQVIRIPDLTDDSHMAEEIFSELSKGVYL